MISVCKICKISFKHKNSVKRVFCSEPCYRGSRRNVRITSDNCTCTICRKTFRRKPSQIILKGGKFCSKKCYGKSQKGKPSWNKGKKMSPQWCDQLSKRMKGKTGENAPHWKGGLKRVVPSYDNDRDERMRFRMTIQKLVLERDDYTCQMCGKRGVELQVDHIQSWSEYVELRFSMDNCRTLCSRCHYKITFGREMPIGTKSWGQNLKHIIERSVS